MTESEVRQTGRQALISTMAMEDVSRAFEKGETKGFMKILVDRYQTNRWRIPSRPRRRRSGSQYLGSHVRQGALYRACSVQCIFIQLFQNSFLP